VRFRLRRCRNATEILELAEPLEPLTTPAVGPVLEGGLGPGTRAWIAERPGGTASGGLVIVRIGTGKWEAFPIVVDKEAAPAIGRRVDRSPATMVSGPPRFVAPVLTGIRRPARAASMRLVAATDPIPVPPPLDPRARLATATDVEALVDLFSRSNLEAISARPELRRMVRDTIDRRAIVLVEDGSRIVGAARCEARTRRYDYWGSGFVLPDFRGRRLSWALTQWTMAQAAALGLRACGVMGPANPMPIEGPTAAKLGAGNETYEITEWLYVRIAPRRRARGHARLRRTIARAEERLKRARS
jgi:hypothetical protein